MLRKNLFLGLTIMLGAVLVYLLMQSREEEKEKREARSTEIIKTSKPSRTRVIYPRDLEIADSSMELVEPAAGSTTDDSAGLQATHRIVIRNGGAVWYHDPLLKLSYLDRDGIVLETRTHAATGDVSPGTTHSFGDFHLEDIPPKTASCKLRILYSDITTAISHESTQESK
jgi:hypothetical protein